MEVALLSEGGVRMLAPSRLDRVESWWAMTIHKSQGSEFPHAVVSLPPAGSPILTRELLYTAVTRAKDQLTVVGQRVVDPLRRRPAGGPGLGSRRPSLARADRGPAVGGALGNPKRPSRSGVIPAQGGIMC